MDVTTILTKSRTQTSTSVGQKSDALMLADLNIVQGDIFSSLNAVSKKYTRQTYKTDSVASQHEYTIPVQSSPVTGLTRVLNVQIKYSSTWDYIPLKMYDTWIPVDNDYTNENIPYCIQRDDSIFIYPAPTTAITDGIMIEGNYQPLPLTLATTSAQIKLKADNHDLLLFGLNMRGFADKQIVDKQIIQKQLFDEWVKKLISQGWMEMEDFYTEETPDFSELE